MRRLAAIAGVALALSSCSSAPSVTARLRSADGDVLGVAFLNEVPGGTRVTVDVAHLEHGSEYRAAVNAGTCGRPGASFLALPDVEAGEHGRARVSGELLFRGRDKVELEELADGEHVVRVYGDDGNVACGVIPRSQRRAR